MIVRMGRPPADRELRPNAAEAEHEGRFSRETFRVIGRAGLLGLGTDQFQRMVIARHLARV